MMSHLSGAWRGGASIGKSACLSLMELNQFVVHVWCVELSADRDAYEGAKRLLSPEESRRAEQFRFSGLRENFVIAHAVLRVLIVQYVDFSPAALKFTYSRLGKPILFHPAARLTFNLSHSGMLATYAFTLDCDLGVDIEQIHHLPDQLGLAREFFSPGEYLDLQATRRDQTDEAFFNCWVRKEAYIKAKGTGLQLALHGFRVSLRPGESARLLEANDDDPRAWSMHEFDPATGYAGAVVYRGRRRQLVTHPRLTAGEILVPTVKSFLGS